MKDALRKTLAEWDETLHFAHPTYWKIENVTDPRVFFQHLPKIFPHGRTLLIEGLEIGLSAKSLYEEYPAVYARKVACDTISPTPDAFHVEFRAEFADRLCLLIQSQGLVAAFYHFKGYAETEVLFTFHDAFEGELLISPNVSESAVRDFASGLGLKAAQEAAPVDLREQLRLINRALNPPWWRRALNVFTRKKEEDNETT